MFVLKLVMQPLHICHGIVQTTSMTTNDNRPHRKFELYLTTILFEYSVMSTMKAEPRGNLQSLKIHWHEVSMNDVGYHVINQKLL